MKSKILFVFVSCLVAICSFGQTNVPDNLQTTVPAAYNVVSALPGTEDGNYVNDNFNYVIRWEPQVPITSETSVTSKGRTVEEVHRSVQYFDGLGRPTQDVLWQWTPGKADFVSTTLYDGFGRVSYQYLPFKSTTVDSRDITTNGFFKYNPYDQQSAFSASNYPGEQAFYSHTVFEASPLNRVLKSFAPGNSWSGSEGSTHEKAVTTSYLTNSTAENIRIWTISNTTLTTSSYDANNNIIDGFNIPVTTATYLDGQLYKTVTTDEDDKKTIEYKNNEGHVILKRVQMDNSPTYYSTYYVYDDFGLLRFVLSPKAVNNLTNGTTITTAIANELSYHYEYDDRHRMIAKKVPGAAWVYMVYDERDRLVYTQDGNLRKKNQWIVNLYDNLNRQVMTGMLTTTSTHQSLIQYVKTTTYTTATVVTGISVNANPFIQGSTFNTLTATAYDNLYHFNATSFNNSYSSQLQPVDPNANVEIFPTSASSNTINLVTGTWTRIVSDPNNIGAGAINTSQNFYDEKGRLIQVAASNISGGQDITSNEYDFAGKIMSSYVYHNNPVANSTLHLGVATDMLYDHQGRTLKIRKRIYENGSIIQSTNLVENTYTPLGQLNVKSLGQQKDVSGYNTLSPIETLDYDYNIRGWLVAINKNYAKYNSNSTANWFGMQLSYDWGFGSNYYNGNISGVNWRSKGDGVKRAYGFGYDNSNRLLFADFNQYTGGTWNQPANINFSVIMGNTGTTADYASAYDENGNIFKMSEKGIIYQPSGATSNKIDDLNYNYFLTSNKLKSVTDAANIHGYGDFDNKNTGTNDDYGYDVNGNLITDKNKNITGSTGIDQNTGGITYNYLNLPSIITVNDDNNNYKGTINYTYDALGDKLEKIVHEKINATTTNITTTDYIGPFVYETNSTSITGGGGNTGTPQLQFISTEEGRMRFGKNASGNDIVNFDYFIKDHLGNVRMVLTDEQKTEDYVVADVEKSIPNALITEHKYYDYDENNIVNNTDIPGLHDQQVADPNDYKYRNNNGNPPYNTNPDASPGAYSISMYKLSAAAATKTGLGTTIKVMSGDVIDIFGRTYYLPPAQGQTISNGNFIQNALTDFLGVFTGSDAVMATHSGVTGAGLSGNTGFTGTLNPWLNNGPHVPPTGNPKAYINWVFLDEQFNVVTGLSGADLATSIPTLHHKTVSITKNGYLYIYCSNESNLDVFFDNLQVVHTHGPLVEENHYYPFGLNMNGISSSALKFGGAFNKYKFAGKELNNDEFSDNSGLELYDFTGRNYDPQLGRWWSNDPLADKAPSLTPYRYGFNNPMRFFDPSGKYEEDGHYWTVYLMATLLNIANAKEIAEAAEWPDAATIPTWMPGLGLQQAYHALTGGDAYYETQKSEDMAYAALTMKDMGIALHRYGDSYAHRRKNNPNVMYGKPSGPTTEHYIPDKGWPDKISNRPELYIMYVMGLDRILNRAFSSSNDSRVDMFTFDYVANAWNNTSRDNDNIFNTEINIRNGLKNPLEIDNSSKSAVSDYLNARNDEYSGDDYSVKTVEVTTYELSDDGVWVAHKGIKSYVVRNNQ